MKTGSKSITIESTGKMGADEFTYYDLVVNREGLDADYYRVPEKVLTEFIAQVFNHGIKE